MKNAKLALVIAFAMTVLSSVRCMVMLFISASSLTHETNFPPPQMGGMQPTLQEQLQATLALQQEQVFHHHQIDLYVWILALVWNLLLAGLLIFAISRLPNSN